MTVIIKYFWSVASTYLSQLNAAKRLLLGFCPMCNSDAPTLYDCPVCSGYHQARGDKFPPPQPLKVWWWSEYLGAIRAKRMTLRLVLDSRLKRNTQKPT